MMKKTLTCLLTVAVLAFTAYVKKDGDYLGDTARPLVIIDTDIGSSADDLFALEMLYHYEEQGRCHLLGVVVDREGETCAACADVMNTYFGRGDVPIGLVRNGIKSPAIWIDYGNLPNHTNPDGSLMFARTLSDYSTLPDGWQLYRRLLAAQPDHSVSIVSVGFVTCLVQLLQSGADEYSPLAGVELVHQKVKCLYIMAGIFDVADEPDFNFSQGIEFAQTLFELWPQDVDMVFSPMEVGQQVEYIPEQVIADIDWTDCHPIKQVYMTYNCNTGQKMWDPMTVIQAVEGDEIFTLSERGIVTLTADGQTHFTPDSSGHCRYQKPGTQQWAASMLEKIRTFNKIKNKVKQVFRMVTDFVQNYNIGIEGHYTYQHSFNYDMDGNHFDVSETGTMDFYADGTALDSARQVYTATLKDGRKVTWAYNYISPSRWRLDGDTLFFAGVKEGFRMEVIENENQNENPDILNRKTLNVKQKIIDAYSRSIDYEYKFHIDTLTAEKLQWSFTYRDGHSDTWTFFKD